MSSDFVKVLFSMVNSWGNFLLEAFVSPLTVRKCAQICFVSLELETFTFRSSD